MSALARYFLMGGYDIAGYDRTSTPLTDELENEGCRIHFKDDIELVPDDFKVIDGTLIDYKIVKDEKGALDYYILTFDDGEIIKVNAVYGTNLDFTVNSKLVIELSKDKDTDIWTVVSVVNFLEL